MSIHGLESRITDCILESRPNVISSSVGIENSMAFAATIVIHKSRNLFGTLGSSEFGP